MKCEEMARYMSLFLDGELEPEMHGEILAHLSLCHSCNEKYQELFQINQFFRKVPCRTTSQEKPLNLTEQILARAAALPKEETPQLEEVTIDLQQTNEDPSLGCQCCERRQTCPLQVGN